MPRLNSQTKLFSGNANRPLAERIAGKLNSKLGAIEVGSFNNGETRVEINEYVADHDIFIIQPTCAPVNQNIMELMIMVDAFRRSGVSSITAVVPLWGYSRQDRRPDYDRTPITSRLIADLMVTAGIDRLITVDLHSGQQKGFFPNHVPVINISATPDLVADIWRRNWDEGTVIVSPDVGGVVRARQVAKQLGQADLAIIDKRRPKAGESAVMHVIGDVSGRRCVVIDDLIDTAGTLCNGAAALKEKGATYVTAYATHGVFSGNAFLNIANSVLDEVVVTDTVTFKQPQYPDLGTNLGIKVVSVADLIAETILRLSEHQSVSAIYVGQ